MAIDTPLTFAALREANIARNEEIDPNGKLSVLFSAVELGGEAGEALNKVKKLVREQLGIPGTRTTIQEIGSELADIIICVDLVAMKLGIDLAAMTTTTFNRTSVIRELKTRL